MITITWPILIVIIFSCVAVFFVSLTHVFNKRDRKKAFAISVCGLAFILVFLLIKIIKLP